MNVFDILFSDSPKITKLLTITILAVSLMTWFEIVSPLNLYINYDIIFKKHQVRIKFKTLVLEIYNEFLLLRELQSELNLSSNFIVS